jgi:mRNA-degrading endonuclease YafQ of YafQ-DinJ toxin-antitoxin module
LEGAGEHPLPRTTNPLIPQHALWMQQHGYRPSTIKGTVKTLKTLSRRCNLNYPDDVRNHLATHPYTENRKCKIINDLILLYKHLAIPRERPRSRRVETLPFLPRSSMTRMMDDLVDEVHLEDVRNESVVDSRDLVIAYRSAA